MCDFCAPPDFDRVAALEAEYGYHTKHMIQPDFYRVVFGNYYPREVLATFRTRDDAERFLEEHDRANNGMLEVEAGWWEK